MNTAREFSSRLADLLAREHGALADFIVALAEFDRKRLWVDLGYSSLFHFLHRELGLSKGAAYYRKTAAELIQRVPEIVEPLRAGRLCMTTIAELANEEILEAGLDLVLAQQAKRKGVVENPRKAPPPAKPDHLPAHVKRAVWARDGGRCQWPLESGGICGSTHRVQFDHIIPRARGGPSTIENVRLACAQHNDLAARQAFGNAWMDRFTHRGRTTAPEGATPPAPPEVSKSPAANSGGRSVPASSGETGDVLLCWDTRMDRFTQHATG